MRHFAIALNDRDVLTIVVWRSCTFAVWPLWVLGQASAVSIVSPVTTVSGSQVVFSATVAGLGNPVVWVPGAGCGAAYGTVSQACSVSAGASR